VLLCTSLTAYFAYHAIYGRHGFVARTKLIERSALLEFEIRSLESVRARLERDVALLGSEPPDPDLVDEIAREVFGFLRTDERVILMPGAR